MRYLLFILTPLLLTAFDPIPVTPYPIVGYRELSMPDGRPISIWYPVKDSVEGTFSNNSWDVFKIVKNQESPSFSPLIVISHGYQGNPHQLSWLVLFLTRAGYTVAGVEHQDLIDNKVHMNHWHRAEDVRFIIDVLLSEGKIDPKRIGVAGFSLGGTTAVWVMGGRSTKLDSLIPSVDFASPKDYELANQALPSLDKEKMAQDWKDPRIKAAFVMAPGWAWLFDEESLKKVQIPTYFIAAEEDSVLVTKNNAGFFSKWIPYSIYKPIKGKVDHFVFVSALSPEEQKKVDPKGDLKFLFKDDPTISRIWVQYQIGEEAARFFDSALNR